MWEVSLVIVEFAGKVNYQGGYSKTLSVWAKPLSRAPFASSRGLSLNADAPHMVFPPVPDREDVLGKKKTLYWLGSKFQHEGHTAKPNNRPQLSPPKNPPSDRGYAIYYVTVEIIRCAYAEKIKVLLLLENCVECFYMLTRKHFENSFILLRYATILYFLDNVEDGGETAFPVADNITFDKEVG